jgi:hypothetical protein
MSATQTEVNIMDNENYEITGYRFVNKFDDAKPSVGDVLNNSFTWDGDERTDDELAGTCAFETVEQCEKYAQYSKGCGWIIEIGGYDEGYGDLDGEILIGDATVISVREW